MNQTIFKTSIYSLVSQYLWIPDRYFFKTKWKSFLCCSVSPLISDRIQEFINRVKVFVFLILLQIVTDWNKMQKLTQKTIGSNSIFFTTLRSCMIDELHIGFYVLIVKVIFCSWVCFLTQWRLFLWQDWNSMSNTQLHHKDCTQSPLTFLWFILFVTL